MAKKDFKKNKAELIAELDALRAQVAAFENHPYFKRPAENIAAHNSDYKYLYNHINAALIRFDTKGCIVSLNKFGAAIAGSNPENFIGKNIKEVFPEQGDLFLKRFKKIIKEKNEIVTEDLVPLPDGNHWFSAHHQPIMDAEGKVTGIQITTHDITERKNSEAELIKSKMELDAIYQNAPIVLMLVDRERRVRKMNSPAIEMSRRPLNESLGLRGGEVLNCVNSYDDPRGCGYGKECRTCVVRNSVLETFKTGRTIKAREATIPYNSGDEVLFLTVLVSTVLIKQIDEDDKVLVCLLDITEQKLAQTAIEESEERYQLLSDATFEAIFLSEKGMCTGQNKTAEKMFGYSLQEALGRPGTEWIIPEDRDKVMQNMLAGFEQPYRVTALKKDGTTFPCEIQGRMMTIKNKPLRITALRDITERKKAEDALFLNEQNFRILVEHINAIPWRFDLKNNRFTYIGKQAERILGYPIETYTDLDSWSKKIAPEDRQDAVQFCVSSTKQGQDHEFEYRCLHTNGSVVWLRDIVTVRKDESGNPVELVGFMLDITEHKVIEDALRAERDLFSAGPVFTIVWDPKENWPVKYVSDNIESILGYTADEMTSPDFNYANLIHPDDLEFISKDVAAHINNKHKNFEQSYRLKHASGHYLWVYDFTKFIWDKNKNLIEIRGYLFDQTSLFATMQELESERQRLFNIIEGTNIGTWEWNIQTGQFLVNERWAETLGYDLETLHPVTVKTIKNLIHQDDLPQREEKINSHLNGKYDQYQFDFRINHKTNENIWIHESGKVISKDEKGKPLWMFGILQDVTTRKNSEEAIKISEKKYRELIELAQEGIWVIDSRNRTTFINPSMSKMLGYKQEEMLNKEVFDFLDPLKRDKIREKFDRKKEHLDGQFDIEFLRKDGHKIYTTLEIAPIFDKNGSYNGAIAGIIDLTERRKAEMQLKTLSAAMEQSPSIVMITDPKGNIEYVNPKFCDVTGYSPDEVYGKNPRILKGENSPKETYKQLWDTILAGEVWKGEFKNRKKDGTLYWEDVKISSVYDDQNNISHFIAVKEDITGHKLLQDEKFQLQKQLRRSQKLETIGTLAGGIAHDFNNILTPIIGYTEMALMELDENEPIHQDLNNSLKAAYRARDLVDQILMFSKRIEKESQPISVHIVVKEVLSLMRSTIPATIKIEHNIDSSCDMVFADASQIHQVIVNLFTNAWHAMENGGTLSVSLHQIKSDAEFSRLHPLLHGTEFICLRVSDTGHGMDEATKERIFEPFFTTKSVDKGTGLGLSVAHGIIQSYNGDIQVESSPGNGSIFTIYLPVVKTKIIEREIAAEGILYGNESILIVDDDKEIGKMLKKMLENFGYSVENFSSSINALQVLTENKNKYDLIISDLTMPGLTGIELAEQIEKLNPDIPVILITGYGDKLLPALEKCKVIRMIIEKPILMNELAMSIREILKN